MSKVVVAQLKSKEEKFEKLKSFLSEKLPEAKDFEGCKGIHACVNDDKKIIILYEIWESIDAHKKYVQWRKDKGVHDSISEMLSDRSFEYYTSLI
jgi:quinol monooxygenase YgiN